MQIKKTLFTLLTLAALNCVFFSAKAQCEVWDTLTTVKTPSQFRGLAFVGTTPYVLIDDGDYGNRLSIMKYQGNNWTYFGQPGFLDNGHITSVEFDMDGAGNAYLSCFADGKRCVRYNGANIDTLGYFYGAPATLKLDHNDIPYAFEHLGFYQNTQQFYYSAVKRYNGTSWDTLYQFTGNGYDDIAFDNNNIPYIAYADKLDTNKLVVKKLVGTTWIQVGAAGISGINASIINLAFDGNNTPFVSYNSYTNNYHVKKFDGSNWVSVSASLPAYFLVSKNGLSRGPNGDIFAQCRQNGGISVYQYTGGNWYAYGNQNIPIDNSNIPKLAADASGQLYIGCKEPDGSKASILKYSGGNWTALGLTGYTADFGYQSSLAISKGGTVYWAMRNEAMGNKLTVNKLVGGQWNWVGPRTISTSVMQRPVVQCDANGFPVVAYVQGTGSYEIIIKRFDGANWIDIGGSITSNNFTNVQLAMDSNGTPYLFSFDYVSDFVVRKFNGSNWVQLGSTNLASFYETNFYLSPAGIPYIAGLVASNGHNVPTIRKFNGSNWITLSGGLIMNKDCWHLALSFDASDVPFLAQVFNNKTQSLDPRLMVFKHDGNTWVKTTSSKNIKLNYSWPFLTRDPSGQMILLADSLLYRYENKKWVGGNTFVPNVQHLLQGSFAVNAGANEKLWLAGMLSNTMGIPMACEMTTRPAAPLIAAPGNKICQGFTTLISSNSPGHSYQWYLNGLPLPGTSAENYPASDSGAYKLIVSNSAGCFSSVSNEVKMKVKSAPLTGFTLVNNYANGSKRIQAKEGGGVYQWFLNSVPLSGATDRKYTVTQSGLYKVSVTKNGCTLVSNDSMMNVVILRPGTAEMEAEIHQAEAPTVYPNPSAGLFLISSDVPLRATVHDTHGRLILVSDQVKQIDLSEKAAGIYILHLLAADGTLVKKTLLVKQ